MKNKKWKPEDGWSAAREDAVERRAKLIVGCVVAGVLSTTLYFGISSKNTEAAKVPHAPIVQYASPVLPYTPTFSGYNCTSDCSGHASGYDWASTNDISSVYDCSGNSNSFIEGCMAFVEENYGYEDSEGYSEYDEPSGDWYGAGRPSRYLD